MTIDQTHPDLRIEPGTIQSNIATLKSIVKAHLSSIPYENLSLHYQLPDDGAGGREQPVCSIRLPATCDKMATSLRGGYCLELNALLAQALRAVGFAVETAQARVVFDPATRAEHQQQHDLVNIWPTHILLLVTTAGGRCLVDVGSAKYSLAEPLPLDQPSAVARGILGKALRLRSTTDTPDNGTPQGYYLQVSVPRERWRDHLLFQDEPAGRAAEDLIHAWMARGPAPRVAAAGSTDAEGDGYVFLEGEGRTTTVTRRRLDGPTGVAGAMAVYFGILPTYMESPRVRVEARPENAW
ncbi:N-acetyltransferase [Cordyceps fumosorosea ARSEF 2679]|uniref:N-acetyltransferase n=1 Tax=Cordyceps fumosorosea (strain ARSEF 2679) TaxID=1081104 RepID=A0A162I7C3_CORFA|nr:N-acetyltransferase [Cordyceps fumosorosea ARSEF 2679]OAA53285.1 N-acetyltransferase [Cordyceps fumosorosea ARSEF 2679]